MKKLTAAVLILLGAVWPFGAHALAMWHLSRVLIHHTNAWLAYTFFIVLLPSPALIYAGFISYLRDYMPFPSNALVAGAASAATMLVVAVLFWLVVGLVGFTIPYPL